MKCPFEIGQKVVCVALDWYAESYSLSHLPEKGKVYQITDIVICRDDAYLSLKEFPPHSALWKHTGFEPLPPPKEISIERFREIDRLVFKKEKELV